jgi:hypothetical protein
LRYWLFVEDYFLPFFSPLRNASAKSQEMDTPFNNNPPMPSSDVMVNPVNPDSKPLAAAHILSTDDWVSGCPMYFRRQVYS